MIEDLKTLPEIESRDAVIVRALGKVVNGPVVARDSLTKAIVLAKSDALLPIFTWIVQELLENRGYKLYDLLDSLGECFQEAFPENPKEWRILADAAGKLAETEDPIMDASNWAPEPR